ncbi:ABC transporter ATP-binding protein (plasmid) [Haloimpatiens sp. FM7330]|uniref:ABC transporter ATP-binding protein n=1 Tax=Haloimpatiens sp. FM7330 TaxID=3298610 RepID=UPI0036348E81
MKQYFFKYKGLLIINILFIVFCSAMEILIAFMVKSIIDIGYGGTLSKLFETVIFSLIFILILYASNYLRMVFQALYLKKTLIVFKNDIFKSILKKDIKSFNKENSAKYISTLTNDINILENDYFKSMLEIIINLVRLILGSTAIIMINVYIALGVFIMGIISICIPIIFVDKISKLKKNYSDRLGNFTIKIKDIFSGFEVVKSFNVEKKVNEDYSKCNYEAENSKYRFLILSSLIQILSKTSGFLVFFTALVIGIYFVLKGDLTLGLLIAAIQLMNNITNPIANISAMFNNIKSVKIIKEKIMKVMKDTNIKESGIEKFSFDNKIVFNDVNFSYNNDRNVLNNISIEINKGQKYALVGISGSGKSTIIKLLLRYYEDFKGKITIDEVSNKKIKFNYLYKLISVIQQNVFMFDNSIKENITLFKNYTQEEISRAIKLSGLEELVKKLPKGIDSSVGENGCNLSGGEKQRIAIARAIIKNTPILILDEATSSLDNQTSYNIEKSLLSLSDLTCIVITHKLNKELLKKYDGIITIKNGEIYEIGTFDELISKKEYFYSLFNAGE